MQSKNMAQVLEEEFALLHGDDAYRARLPGEEPEKRYRRSVHNLKQPQAAICLSGGGVRSATFCLGVLQGLAARKELHKYHYMSSVSGGGYIASWLSSWIAREGLGTVIDKLKPARQASKKNPRMTPEAVQVRHLRAYANYLSPVRGLSLDFFTLVATFIRNLTLHWLVLIPLLAAFMMLPRLHVALTTISKEWVSADGVAAGFSQIGIWLLTTGSLIYVFQKVPSHRQGMEKFSPYWFGAILLIALCESILWPDAQKILHRYLPQEHLFIIGLGALSGLLAVAFSHPTLARWKNRLRKLAIQLIKKQTISNNKVRYGLAILFESCTGLLLGALAGGMFVAMYRIFVPEILLVNRGTLDQAGLYAMLFVPTTMFILWICVTIYAGISRAYTLEDDREWWGRATALLFWTSLLWIALHAIALFAPDVLIQMSDVPQAGAGVGLLGIISSLYGYWSKKAERYEKKITAWLSAVGLKVIELAAMIFIVSLLTLISYGLALIVHLLENPAASATLTSALYASVTLHAGVALLIFLAVGLGVFSCGASYLVGTNTFSLHNMYGNRLVRAYLGASRASRNPEPFAGFDLQDNLKMRDARDALKRHKTGGRRLFHVVNIALNMVKPSPAHLDWQQRKAAAFTVSALHAGSSKTNFQTASTYSGTSGISLGRAMTISGAAASPNMGYHSSTLVGFVMAFFNIRLGWWLPNPGEVGVKHWRDSEPNLGPLTLLAESLSETTAESKYVYLSDGGHFENLGLYEMVRRRCKEILVVDASCDPQYLFEDLDNAVRKIRVDFGISIVFPHGLPTPVRARGNHCHFSIGVIRYSNIDSGKDIDGRIIYIKPVLSGDEPLDLQRYAAAIGKDPRFPFPQHSTADQFFDEVQFESYRALGYHSVMAHLPAFGQGQRYPSTSSDADEDDMLKALQEKDPVASAVAEPPAKAAGATAMVQAASNAGIIWALLAIAAAITMLSTLRATEPPHIQGQVLNMAQSAPAPTSPNSNQTVVNAELNDLKQMVLQLKTIAERGAIDPAILNVVEKQIVQMDALSQNSKAAALKSIAVSLTAIRNQMPTALAVNDRLDKIAQKLDAVEKTIHDGNAQVANEVRHTGPSANIRPVNGGHP